MKFALVIRTGEPDVFSRAACACIVKDPQDRRILDGPVSRS